MLSYDILLASEDDEDEESSQHIEAVNYSRHREWESIRYLQELIGSFGSTKHSGYLRCGVKWKDPSCNWFLFLLPEEEFNSNRVIFAIFVLMIVDQVVKSGKYPEDSQDKEQFGEQNLKIKYYLNFTSKFPLPVPQPRPFQILR